PLMNSGKSYIYGRHALIEAIRNAPKSIDRVFILPEFKDRELSILLEQSGIHVVTTSDRETPRGVDKRDTRQGIIALISPKGLVQSFKNFLDKLIVTPDTCLVLLDELEDPQNVGAIIRSAAAFGVYGILIPEHNQAPITGAVIKVSAGMAFRIPLVSVSNVNSSIRDLKNKGFWVYGLEMEAKNSLYVEKFDAPALFVMGNEGQGIRQKTKELCDVLMVIPMNPKCESLNVATSAAVTLYEWSKQHKEALRQ
ncbi:MAG: 23S rRNA (guanosine(2251)-2'-O)-methyltransferase RlmB, partial [Candidatus Vogelbacteria bacterium]|nr:23S rRNA (guanosine(2251)-2'-O)-methyltransferase RlmB [Candidatus Vogelbacteria bacterium]